MSTRPKPPVLTGSQLLQACATAAARGQYIQSLQVAGKSGYRILRLASLPRPRLIQPELPLKSESSKTRSRSPRSAWWFQKMRAAASGK